MHPLIFALQSSLLETGIAKSRHSRPRKATSFASASPLPLPVWHSNSKKGRVALRGTLKKGVESQKERAPPP